jgi:TetR/AcrR family transcriptional repressor of nem operon
MASPRRVGAETSETRSLLLDGTERLMLDEGYAAVTYRRVASVAGVTAPLVQYYFPTLDDLFLALLRRRSDRNLEKLRETLHANPESPLRVIWEYSADETSAALMVELMALGNHRKVVQTEIAEVTRRSRQLQLEALSASRSNRKGARNDIPNPAILFLIAGIPRILQMESTMGVSIGHDETLATVERYLDWAEPVRPHSRTRKAPSTPTVARRRPPLANRNSAKKTATTTNRANSKQKKRTATSG